MSSARTQLFWAAGACAAFAVLLVCFPPQRYAFYPVCPFYEYLGVQCPGCGLTRALADLLTGQFREAASHNAMVFALVPAALCFVSVQAVSVLRWNRWREVRFPQRWASAACAAMLIFGMLRR